MIGAQNLESFLVNDDDRRAPRHPHRQLVLHRPSLLRASGSWRPTDEICQVIRRSSACDNRRTSSEIEIRKMSRHVVSRDLDRFELDHAHRGLLGLGITCNDTCSDEAKCSNDATDGSHVSPQGIFAMGTVRSAVKQELVGWVERSDTHPLITRHEVDGYRFAPPILRNCPVLLATMRGNLNPQPPPPRSRSAIPVPRAR